MSYEKVIGTSVARHCAVPALSILLFIFDRAAKWFALNTLPAEGWFVIPGTTGFVLEHNEGIAYGIRLPQEITIAVTVCAVIAIGFFCIRAYQKKNYSVGGALVLLGVGAFSNLLDRIRYDGVIDTFVLTSWPVFNIADLMVLVGVCIVLYRIVFHPHRSLRSE
ncbi:MAG: signal peptidase II [Patescibacteria group bacterium]|nr:signal peptidase II [Patescibacteria group bacterium]MDD5715505.1 signal peptidase II [Patescibacteria group bacterium]